MTATAPRNSRHMVMLVFPTEVSIPGTKPGSRQGKTSLNPGNPIRSGVAGSSSIIHSGTGDVISKCVDIHYERDLEGEER